VKPVPRWRIAAAIAVMLALLGFGVLFTPVYAHNLELQNYVAEITRNVASSAPGNVANTDAALTEQVVDKARALHLPVTAENVHITHPAEGTRIDVRYFVRVTMPGYTVDLHFYPGAGSH
jgi:hypothetical protein